MEKRKEIPIDDGLSGVLSMLKSTHSDFINYKSFLRNNFNLTKYEMNVKSIYDILKTELKYFFRKYYENDIDIDNLLDEFKQNI